MLKKIVVAGFILALPLAGMSFDLKKLKIPGTGGGSEGGQAAPQAPGGSGGSADVSVAFWRQMRDWSKANQATASKADLLSKYKAEFGKCNVKARNSTEGGKPVTVTEARCATQFAGENACVHGYFICFSHQSTCRVGTVDHVPLDRVSACPQPVND